MNYIIEVSICWLGFYLLYVLLLSKETFFKINRIYLLSTLLAGLVIPLLNLQYSIPMMEGDLVVYLEPITVGVQSFENTLEEIVVTGTKNTKSYTFLWPLIYGLGVGLLSLRFFYGIWQITQLKHTGKSETQDGYTIVETKDPHLPFSFFNTLYWSKATTLEHVDKEKIFEHELAHIRGKHSYDVLFIELLSILMWCSPLIFLYKRSIRNIHEYLADAQVLQTTQKKQYGQLLLKQLQSGFTIALANNFNHSQLKKRFNMMMKNKSTRRALLKYLPLLPLAAVLLMAFAVSDNARFEQWPTLEAAITTGDFDPKKVEQEIRELLKEYQNGATDEVKNNAFRELSLFPRKYPEHRDAVIELMEKIIKEVKAPITITANDENAFCLHGDPQNKILASNGEQIYQVVDQMPFFPGCELSGNARMDKKCADQKMLEFIYKNIQYPKEAREKGIEGVVMIRFVVDQTGEVVAPEIMKSLGGGCDETVLEIISQMPKWTPGVHQGKAVNVYFNLPIRFKLDGDAKASLKQKASKLATKNDMAYKVVEEMPRFKGCENITDIKDREDCAKKELLNYIYSNIKYPKIAAKNDIEGVVVTQFVVDTDGSIKDAKVIQSIGGGCDEEVLRVIESMDKWIPGKQSGKLVKVVMNIPVKFKLEGEKTEKGDEQLTLKNFSLSPNPTSEMLNIRFESTKGPSTLEIYDLNGKMAATLDFNVEGIFERSIDLSSLAKGAVFVKVTRDGKVFTEKVIYQ